MRAKKIILTGNNLRTEDLLAFVSNEKTTVSIARVAYTRIRRSRSFLEREATRKIIYGVNTGFGPMASYIVGKHNLEELQRNLVLGHAVGMGQSLPNKFVLASMLVRLNTLVRGYSGVSVQLIDRLKDYINRRIVPIIPEHGAVGTSGDLTQLAHIALALIGEGEVFYKGRHEHTKTVLKKLRLKPYVLKSKEGLALINGTSTMSGIASLLMHDAEQILSVSIRNSAFALELVGALSDSVSKRLHDLRPHDGQVITAQILRRLLSSSKLLKSRTTLIKEIEINSEIHKINDHIQEIYSFRCIPQILGPVLDTYRKTKSVINIEINSVTDNPIIDVASKQFIHGGNFHGDYVAAYVDQLKIALVKLSMLSERRINFMLNSRLNEKFPPFLNLHTPGLTIGLQGLQFVATSTTAQNQSFAYPHHIHSIPTNADNQDVVSMGTDTALIAAKVVDNMYIVLAIELVVLTQIVDYLDVQDKLSDSSKELYRLTRRQFPKLYEDRVIVRQLASLVETVKKNEDLLIHGLSNR